MKERKVTQYQCDLHGWHSDINQARCCNLAKKIGEMVNQREIKLLSDDPTTMAMEVMMLAHFIIHNPLIAESLTQDFLDSLPKIGQKS